MHLKIKPLSVNQAWKGRRYKTDKYKSYIKELLFTLRPMKIPEGYLRIHLIWGLSSRGGDFDNPIKPFVDCLQKKYGFNDNRIKQAIIEVEHVKKGDEFIKFEIEEMK